MELSNPQEEAWIAVQVRPRSERIVAAQLTIMGYEHFVPRYPKLESGRSLSGCPLFPGYVFSRFMPSNPNRIVRITAVVRLLGSQRGPMPVPDHEIDALRRVTNLGLPLEPLPTYEPGDRVRVISGPLTGIEGTLIHARNRWKMALTVTILQRAVAVEVHVRDVEPVLRPVRHALVGAAASHGVEEDRT
jgi:transcription antitermination factor NusG